MNAQATQEFSTAAFRVGHSQVSGTQEGIDNTGAIVFTQNLAEAFFNKVAIDLAHGINPLLRSLGTDFSQATDVYAIPELRDLLVAGLVGGGVDLIDLIAIDIQLQRDVGLGTLNQTRKAPNMSPYRQTTRSCRASCNPFTVSPVILTRLSARRRSNVDLFIGGLAEKHAAGALVGQTFKRLSKTSLKL